MPVQTRSLGAQQSSPANTDHLPYTALTILPVFPEADSNSLSLVRAGAVATCADAPPEWAQFGLSMNGPTAQRPAVSLVQALVSPQKLPGIFTLNISLSQC